MTISGPALMSSSRQRQKNEIRAWTLSEAGADSGSDGSLDMGTKGPDLVMTGAGSRPCRRGGAALCFA